MRKFNIILKSTKVFLLFLSFLFSNFLMLFSTLNFANRNAYFSLLDNTSEFRLSNQDSVAGYKKQAIMKKEPADALFLQDNQVWQTNADQFAPEETFEFIDNLQIPDGQIVEFSTNAVIDGQGHDLILGKYAQLLVDGGITVTFKNMTFRNELNTISCPPIHCVDWYSQACFDNVTFAFNDDWAFRNGQFFVHNDVNFTGTSKFSYRSGRPSYITQHANMIFDPLTTFEYYPSTTDNSLIKMADKTASIIFDGSTLLTTHTGIRLTKGNLYFDNKVTLSSVDNTLLSSLLTAIQVPDGNNSLEDIEWSPDGKYLAIGSSGLENKIYRFYGSSLVYLTGVTSGQVLSIAWSPDGKYLAYGEDTAVKSTIYSFNGNSLTLVATFPSQRNLRSIAWSPDGKYLAIGTVDITERSEIYRFDGSSLTLTASTKYPRVTASVAWSPDGKHLALGNGYNTSQVSEIYRFDGSSLSLTASTKYARFTNSLAWSPDGQYVALGNGLASSQVSDIYRFNGNSLSFIVSTQNASPSSSVSWSPDGKYLALGNYFFSGSEIYSFNGNSLTLMVSLPSGKYTNSVSWSPDGRYLAFGNLGVPFTYQQSDVYPISYRYDISPQGFSNGIIFGNSAVGSSQDLDVYALAAARVGIYGKVWHDSINSWNFQSRDSYLSLDRYDSQFKITNAESVQNWKKNQIIKSSAPNTMFLQDNQIWTTNMNQLAPEETFEFMDNLVIPDGQITQFAANAVIDGQGHDLILGKYAQLLVDGGVTVTFKNMTIKNTLNTISCPPIRCMDWYSQACFDNVTFAFNDDWAFRNGQFFVHNDINFTGTSKFSYRSVRPSYITQHANMIFDSLTTFEYYPSTTDNKLIKMTDKTSSIIFDGSTLQTTHTGIRLTKGSIYFDNKVTLSSADNTMLTGLTFMLTSTERDYIAESIAWSPDGRYLAIGNITSTVKVLLYKFDGTNLTLTYSSGGLSRDTRSIDWSPDGKYIAVGNRGAGGGGAPNELYKVEGERLRLVFETSETNNTWSFMWHPSGKYIVASNYADPVQLYKLVGDSLVLVSVNSTTNQNIRSVWTPDGKYMISGSHAGGAYNIYQLAGETLTIVSFIPSWGAYICPAITPDGKYVAFFNGAGADSIRFYRLSGTTLSLIYSLSGSFWQGSWSPDGHYFITADAATNSRKVYRRDGETISLVFTYSGGFKTYTSNTAWSPDGKFIAFNTTGGRTWVMGVNYTFDTLPQGYSNSIIFGNSALGTTYDTDIYVLSAANVVINGKIWYDDVN